MKIGDIDIKKNFNSTLISDSDLYTMLDNLSRKYCIKVIPEYQEYVSSSMSYSPRRKAVMVNIPKLLNIINEKKAFLKCGVKCEDGIEMKFLHEYHHSKINPICRETAITYTESRILLNVCEDYYVCNVLMKDNKVLCAENLIFREEFSKRAEENKVNIEHKDIYTIFVLCSIYDKGELKEMYGEDIIEYKKIFESIKGEDDICRALSELSSYGDFTFFFE